MASITVRVYLVLIAWMDVRYGSVALDGGVPVKWRLFFVLAAIVGMANLYVATALDTIRRDDREMPSKLISANLGFAFFWYWLMAQIGRGSPAVMTLGLLFGTLALILASRMSAPPAEPAAQPEPAPEMPAARIEARRALKVASRGRPRGLAFQS